MSAPETCGVVVGSHSERSGNHISGGEGGEFLHYAECLAGNDGLVAVGTLEGLVVEHYERLLTQIFHIGNGLELEVFGGDGLRDALLEGNDSSDVGHGLIEIGSNKHLAGHTRQFHRQRLLVLG